MFRNATVTLMATWIALSSYARTAVYDSRVLHANDISSYADLAKTKWSQKLCMSQGRYIPNQSLVVNLINNLGDKKSPRSDARMDGQFNHACGTR